MVVKMSSPGRSFGGVADYCLHDPRMPGEAHHPESAERVEWTETRNLATSEGERAARIMAATAEASPDLKHLAGGAATGRKLEKPVCHYSLSWAKDERPDRQEMKRAAAESLKALGLERHQTLIVSHRDGQPHVHEIANRVDPESGKAAGLSRSKLRLSKWAEDYEREQGKIRCPQRERNNMRRAQGERVAWQRAEERTHWARFEQERRKALGELERRSKREWSALYGRQERQREQLGKDCRGVLGRFRLWRELGGGAREIGGAVRGRPEVLEGFRAELEDRLRWERVSLGKEHSEAVRGIESKAGEFYRGGMEGSEKRAREAARSDGLLLESYRRPDEFYRLKYSMLEERLEQVREIDGEQAYEKMRRAVKKASQEKASQEKARLERARQVESRPERRGPERSGPKRGGPERDYGPSR